MKMFTAVILTLVLIGCDMRPSDQRPENFDAETTNAGVVVHGYDCAGYIQNTNQVPVRVKQVWAFRGETTIWLKVFQPEEKQAQYVSNQNRFYVYDMNGVEIGFIYPSDNGKEK